MRLALIQPALTADVGANLRKTLALMEMAAESGARAVFFPELQLSPFFPRLERRDASGYAVTVKHEAVGQMRRKCADLNVTAFPNLYLREGDQYYDASLAINSNGDLLGVSKMVHVVQAPRFFEQDYYTPSDTGFRVYDTAVGRIGVVVCFDRHYPESFRTCALRGARLIVVPTANTWGEPLEMFEWEMRVSAMQNGVYVAMCNRIGVEGEMRFSGGSVVIDPGGEIVAKAGEREEVLVAEVDLPSVERSQAARSYLPLRRPSTFECCPKKGVEDAQEPVHGGADHPGASASPVPETKQLLERRIAIEYSVSRKELGSL